MRIDFFICVVDEELELAKSSSTIIIGLVLLNDLLPYLTDKFILLLLDYNPAISMLDFKN